MTLPKVVNDITRIHHPKPIVFTSTYNKKQIDEYLNKYKSYYIKGRYRTNCEVLPFSWFFIVGMHNLIKYTVVKIIEKKEFIKIKLDAEIMDITDFERNCLIMEINRTLYFAFFLATL